jgi:hypothetical protein
MNLYWVETDDHDEDWFVVARDALEAAAFHEESEGYASGDATATFVTEVPDGLAAAAGWPSHELLEACGAAILRADTLRVVKFGERQFCEGALDHEISQLTDEIFDAQGRGRPNQTSRRTEH